MRHVTLAALAAVLVLALAAPAHAQLTYDHPDECYVCHSEDTGTPGDLGLGDRHYVTAAADAWDRCARCHTAGTASAYGYAIPTEIQEVEANLTRSVHSGIGCKCHAVTHTGMYAGDNTWAAIFKPTYTPPATKPTALVERKYAWLNTTLAAKGEVEFFLMTKDFEVVPSGSEYVVCFNCHFLTVDPALYGAIKVEGGEVKIGIPEFALKLPPHAVTWGALRALATGGAAAPSYGPAPSFGSLLALLSALAGALLLRRRL